MTYIETILGAIAGVLSVTEAPSALSKTATSATTDSSQRLLNRGYWGPISASLGIQPRLNSSPSEELTFQSFHRNLLVFLLNNDAVVEG